jgi:uncharacterized protein (TIGR03382 family)
MGPSGFIGAGALACVLVSTFAWLTWRRRLARRTLVLGIAGGMAFLLASGGQHTDGSTWLPALSGSLGLVAMAFVTMAARGWRSPAVSSAAYAASRSSLPPNGSPPVLARRSGHRGTSFREGAQLASLVHLASRCCLVLVLSLLGMALALALVAHP